MSSSNERNNEEIIVANKRVRLVETNASPSGVTLVNEYRTNKHSRGDLVELAAKIQNADSFVKANVSNKLTIIAEQVRFLQEQARKVLQEANENYNLHHVSCNFVKKPGQIYFLYEKDSGQKYFSMLSPEEWGSSCPHKFHGAFRLEHDQSWTPEEKFREYDDNKFLIDKILSHSISNSLPDAIMSE